MSRRSEQVSLFAALLEAGAEYAVVGGVAVNAHGFVRNTRDLDVFFRPSMENAEAVFRALKALGAPLEGVGASDLLSGDGQFQIETEHGRIDLLPSIGEMTFEQVWRNRVDAVVDGVTVHFISKADLLENKRQVGRTIDLADVEELSRVDEIEDLRLPTEE